jgi:hypothetical protein
MGTCPYCGSVTYPGDVQCRKCDGALVARPATLYAGPKKVSRTPQVAQDIRRKALAVVVIGLLLKVYWGGYGPWPVVNDPTLLALRKFAEPLLLCGGTMAYLTGWFVRIFG